MPGHDRIVIGASAGGVEALAQLVAHLPADLPAAIFVVLHVPAQGTSVLPQILTRRGPLPAHHAVNGEVIKNGQIYVAPPDYHLLLKPGHVRVAHGPRENSHRPAADPLFRTAAQAYGPRVVGVVLSGARDDGTAGIAAIRRRGGVAIAQDPSEAYCSGMPQSAIDQVGVDYCLPVAEIASLLTRLAKEEAVPVEGVQPVSDDMAQEAGAAELSQESTNDKDRPGTPSAFACPECGGVLWEMHDSDLLRFRCRVGHAWSANSLLAEQTEALETALWMAFRALEEKAALGQRMANRAHGRGYERLSESFQEQANEAEQHAEVIRKLLLTLRPAPLEQSASDVGKP